VRQDFCPDVFFASVPHPEKLRRFRLNKRNDERYAFVFEMERRSWSREMVGDRTPLSGERKPWRDRGLTGATKDMVRRRMGSIWNRIPKIPKLW
jgi:hypothetical protein